MSKKAIGTTLALAAALAFAAAPMTSMAATAHGMQCHGANACKGTTACGTKDNKCKGMNACKGKGWVEAKSKKECAKLKKEAKKAVKKEVKKEATKTKDM